MLPFVCKTLQELLLHRAGSEPDRTAYVFLSDVNSEQSSLTYSELEKRARIIAAAISASAKVGDRALLLYPPGLDYIAAFFGCVYAGVVAVPAYPPRQNHNLLRVQNIVSDASATIALTTSSALSRMSSVFREYPALETLPWVTTDDLAAEFEDSWEQPRLQNSDVVFLQYTSGSTGRPKGVVVKNKNLLHNLNNIHERFGNTRESLGVIWLPPYHDMGLIGGVLEPLYGGHPVVLMLPTSFLKRPLKWLQTISDWKATHSGGPDFAYDLCARRITEEERESLDLSTWKIAFTGAEPVRLETIERFSDTFASCGFRRESFYPCYGLAEATLMVSGSAQIGPPAVEIVQPGALENHSVMAAAAEDPHARSIVGCGSTLAEQKIAIVNPETLVECGPDSIGEIWVSGPSVASGYWNSQEDSAFQGYLSDTGKGPFLRTGDLGFLKHGELFVTGRLKDLIIIGGLNYYPQDIEVTAENSHPALRRACGAAFSIDVNGAEQLAIVQEIDLRQKPDPDQVVKLIQQSIAENHGLETHSIVLIKSGSIPKTSSGKIQRKACRAAFLDAGLRSIKADLKVAPDLPNVDQPSSQPSSERIQDWLRTRLAKQLKISPEEINVNSSFASFGLGSLRVVRITGELEAWLGRQLSSTLAYDYPTIAALSKHLSGTHGDSDLTAIDSLRSKSALGHTEPIAIIGIGCRFPGASDLEAFWQLLRDGQDAISELSGKRVALQNYSDGINGSGDFNTRHSGFLDQVDQFDPQFFGISAREAVRMDPQQRLLLEVAWEAFENAGQAAQSLAGSQAGIFLGISNSDYSWYQLADYADIDIYSTIGNAHSIAANRLSYFFDLKGPSLAIDTACSSSLVAVHQACASLKAGECNLALAGGVSLILTPHLTISFSKSNMLSKDARSKTFDAAANGYVRGEGCGLVVLKRLGDALRDHDPIMAIVLGSAINQDGFSNGLTAPSGNAQKAVIRQALRNAGVQPNEIGYVEAHGTGTSLGDPIEMNSLIAVLSEGRSTAQACRVGSVKTNIGHLEAAAGIAGLIKTVLSLQHREIPPHLHLQKLNPLIELEGTAFSVPTEAQPWTADTDRRLAGVSSFGFGGTNAHLILEEPPVIPPQAAGVERLFHLITLSANNDESLRMLASRYQDFLNRNPAAPLADICFSANTGRSHFSHRLGLVVESTAELQTRLGAIIAGQNPSRSFRGQSHSERRLSVAFLFTGQGSQYKEMGRQLYECSPSFRKVFDRCAELLQPYLKQSLLDCIYPTSASDDSSLLNETAYTQSALFALEYSLARLWLSWGIKPEAVMGHSIGEYVAACIAGVFSLEEAIRLVGNRARLMQALPAGGEMASVSAPEELVSAAIADYQSIAIAAINGPRHTLVSGAREEVTRLLEELFTKGIKAQRLAVSHAFHSPLMEPILSEFSSVAQTINYSLPKIKLISNITGQVIGDRIATPDYWCEQILKPVLFAKGMQTLRAERIDAFLEIGPRPTLQSLGQQCLGSGNEIWLSSLRQGADCQQLLESLAALYVKGATVQGASFDGDFDRRRLQVPTYQFQRQSYWTNVKTPEAPVQPTAPDLGTHPLLGRRLHLPLAKEIRYEAQLDLGRLPFLADQKTAGVNLLPIMSYVEIALAAAAKLAGSACRLQHLNILNSRLLLTNEPVIVQVLLDRDNDKSSSFRLVSCVNEPALEESGTLHATGTILFGQKDEAASQRWALEALQERCDGEIPADRYYRRLRDLKLEYGASFRAIERLWSQEWEAFALLNLPGSLSADAIRYQIHPVLLEACLQVLLAALPPEILESAYLPIAFESIRFVPGRSRRFWVFARLQEDEQVSPDEIKGEFCLFDEDGSVVLEAEGVSIRRVDKTAHCFVEPQSIRLHDEALRYAQASERLRDHDGIIHQSTLDFQRLAETTGIEIYKALVPEVDRLSALYISRALRTLGLPDEPGRRVSIGSLAKQLGVVKDHERLLGRFLEILQQDGALRRVDDELEVCGFVQDADPQALLEDLLRRYSPCSHELLLLARCGQNLSSVLRGESEPLQLLFPPDSEVNLEKIYQESPAARLINQLCRATIETAIAPVPEDRTLRILEIGAGTGSTTSVILPSLPASRTDYVFSDVSPLFLFNAKRKFAGYPFIRYELLDIEQPPDSQGFVNHQFDLVLAANVMHAACDVRRALRHVRQLLATEGLLVMAEGISRQRAADIMFGLLKGWWGFQDYDLRTDHPLLSPGQWCTVLRAEGFAEAATVPGVEQTEAYSCQQSLIVAGGPSLPDNATRDFRSSQRDYSPALAPA
jgi:acyl transferase domain-containing protein/acyl-CoA synthetase (AMP-forming)/AMP-acid ligase II/acyl carrier protein